jgi:hypothetical protein
MQSEFWFMIGILASILMLDAANAIPRCTFSLKRLGGRVAPATRT